MENENQDENLKRLQTKADYFYDKNIPVHIEFKKDYWKNGHIIEVSSDFFILREFQEGEIPIFFLEIEEINKFIELKGGN